MIGIIIQARSSSTRLPGKVFRKLAGKEMILHVVERCQKSKLADTVMVATSTDSSDDQLAALCEQNSVPVFRGSLDNVLERYYQCAKQQHLDLIMRVTGDCPFIDPFIIDQTIELYKKSNVQYVSNVKNRIFPRGLDCELFSFALLEKAYQTVTQAEGKEHVTKQVVSTDPNGLAYNVPTEYRGNFRLTMDEETDYEVIKTLYDLFYQEGEIIDVTKVIEYLNYHPELSAINQRVEQKSSIN